MTAMGRRSRLAAVLSIGVLVAAPRVAFGQTAILKKTESQQHVLVVTLPGSVEGTPQPADVTLSRAGAVIKSSRITPLALDDGMHVRFTLPLDRRPDDVTQLVASLVSGGVHWYDDLPVAFELKNEFSTAPGHLCTGGVSLRFAGDAAEDTPESVWKEIFDFLFTGSGTHRYSRATSPPTELLVNDDPASLVKVRVSSEGRVRALPLRSMSTRANVGGATVANAMTVCLDPAAGTPDVDFTIEARFIKKDPPLALAVPLRTEKVGGMGSPLIENAAAKPGEPGSRPKERNLDVGGTLTRSQGGDDKHVTRGVLDLRLAPLLNWRRSIVPSLTQEWFSFWTPIYVDANVATGEIVKDTLSLNRIEFASEVELRYLPLTLNDDETSDTRHFTTYHRVVLAAKHSSDRDFQQREYTASVEWRPVFAALNHPIRANWITSKDPLTGKTGFVPGRYGWEFKPKAGINVGRTYKRLNPALAIVPSPTVRRLYLGGDVTLNLTPNFTTTFTNVVFIRGEVDTNRSVNYLNLTVDAPLGRPLANTVHGVFASYERGNQPPFTSPDVEALIVGYRVRSSGWNLFSR